jgi:hypothetical protein
VRFAQRAIGSSAFGRAPSLRRRSSWIAARAGSIDSAPSAVTARCQGVRASAGQAETTRPAARAPVGRPASAATSPYVRVSPFGIFDRASM